MAMSASKSIFIKYDGDSANLKNHLIDAKFLGEALTNISELIYESNIAMNGIDAPEVKVQAKAGFQQGSFGLEIVLIGSVAAAIIAALGLNGSNKSKISLLELLNFLKGLKPADIVIDKQSNTVKIRTKDGGEIDATEDVLKLLESEGVQKKLDKVAYQPLEAQGVIKSVQFSASKDYKKSFTVSEENRSYFKKKRSQTSEVEEKGSIAKIEFTRANRESGTSGWKMIHLGEEKSVKIEDEGFLEQIKRPDSKSIFGLKYSVDLLVKTRQKADDAEVSTYIIKEVRGVSEK